MRPAISTLGDKHGISSHRAASARTQARRPAAAPVTFGRPPLALLPKRCARCRRTSQRKRSARSTRRLGPRTRRAAPPHARGAWPTPQTLRRRARPLWLPSHPLPRGLRRSRGEAPQPACTSAQSSPPHPSPLRSMPSSSWRNLSVTTDSGSGRIPLARHTCCLPSSSDRTRPHRAGFWSGVKRKASESDWFGQVSWF